ncbi:glycosyltransferase family 4 protein [Salinisphaera sp.]|uniref:glycosyltransferase family 4 protein n=1 Tax=Salinisphaera sp. TaxID=1914330 RepID=UPI002D794D8B|nr:glycosyltransferase family 4 protein [Salinisphaera sp.]HET7313236.1 glycosyltransferase family 4 protein [Salinisphaera sp.]
MGFPPDLGGVQTYAYEIAQAYKRRGLRCCVVTSRTGPRGLAWEDGVCVINVGVGSQTLVAVRMLRVLRRLRRSPYLRKSTVHVTTWRVGAAVATAGWRYFLTVHGREVVATRQPVFKWLMYRVLDRAELILSVSRFSMTECVPPRYAYKALYRWNGVSAWALQLGNKRLSANREASKTLTILFAARLIRGKNPQAAIKAFAKFLEKGGRGRLIIAGEGSERKPCERHALDLDVATNVEFVGHVRGESLVTLYQNADIFIHPHSALETFCISIADAMASGLAVISGLDGAPPEYLSQRLGFVVDGDDPGHAADALLRLYEDASLRREIGRHAALFAAEHFSWDRHVAPILDASDRPKFLTDGIVED